MKIEHRNQLPELLRHLKLPLIACEVGVAEGYNSADLLASGLDRLYMVDAWKTLEQVGDASSVQEWHDKNYNAALERVKPFGDKAVVLRGLTAEMAKEIPDNTLGLLYIDAGHDYNSVMADLNNYFNKVVNGGVISGHDYLNTSYGVRKAVEEFCAGKYEVHVIPEDESHPEYASFYFIKA